MKKASGFCLLCVLFGVSCAQKREQPAPAPGTSSASSTATPALQASPSAAASAWPVPTGVSLPIFAGKGVGPIRIGATVATIERLMERECEVKNETLCGYNGRAVDFELAGGKTVRIHVHRSGRQNLQLLGATYGMFNGGFANGIRLEMLKTAVVEAFGQSKRVESVSDPGPWNIVERAVYDGMVLEYDRLGSGVVLGGVIIESTEAGK